MPPGLNLKSLAFATSIHVPEPGHSFPEWCRARGLEDYEPCPMECYAAYGMWMKDRFVWDVDPSEVTEVTAAGHHLFDVTTASGERVRARNVVSATGLYGLAYTPDEMRALPPALHTHTFELSSYQRFAGQYVAVVGAGSSAIEAAALVHEAGGRSELLVRAPVATFNSRTARDRSLIDRIRTPMTVLGAGRKNWLLQTMPYAVRLLPEQRRVRLVQAYLPPTAPWWIRDRVEGKVVIRVRTRVVEATPVGDRVRLRLREDGGQESSLEVDHVISGTGYALDLDRMGYLEESLRRHIQRVAKAPRLSIDFESSVPGLYFVGAVSAMSFGPVFRFVAGARVAAPAIARTIALNVRRRLARA
jgi:cation diffusion facilitator CzcD-associated flavoprotein CzcO